VQVTNDASATSSACDEEEHGGKLRRTSVSLLQNRKFQSSSAPHLAAGESARVCGKRRCGLRPHL